jgi:D-alanyl-lipoteichoic acid acyltransferase DltB (MBOAT superfamily)
MTFFSPWFLPFVVAAAIVARASAARLRWVVLLCASLGFYAGNGPRDLCILVVLLAVNLGAVTSSAIKSRSVLIALLSFNLASLVLFKYVPWLYFDVFNGSGSLGLLDAGLPLGISFYVFQLTALAVDSHRAQGSLLTAHQAATFTTFFPQLVAGPILRARDHGRQFAGPSPRADEIPSAIVRITWGVFKKRVVADSLSPVVGAQFSHTAELTSPEAIAGILAFMLQIYLDFSAYADMAIGIGQLFGIQLPENFRSPYLATSLRDFWRRWHITLSSWLRDYLYISLGGNRQGKLRESLSVMITMLLGGLWHGANWTFLAWGGWHGLALLGERALVRSRSIPKWISAPITFLVVAVGWVCFRADSIGQAFRVLGGCFRFGGATIHGFRLLGFTVLLMAGLLVAHKLRLKERVLKSHPALQGLIVGLLAALVYFVSAIESEFIYWRF